MRTVWVGGRTCTAICDSESWRSNALMRETRESCAENISVHSRFICSRSFPTTRTSAAAESSDAVVLASSSALRFASTLSSFTSLLHVQPGRSQRMGGCEHVLLWTWRTYPGRHPESPSCALKICNRSWGDTNYPTWVRVDVQPQRKRTDCAAGLPPAAGSCLGRWKGEQSTCHAPRWLLPGGLHDLPAGIPFASACSAL